MENIRSHPPQPKRQAYIWCRQFSRDRLAIINGVVHARRWWLDEETATLSRFSRLQIGNTDKWYNASHSIEGRWENRDVYFDPVIRPLFIRYAVAIFRQALKDTLEHDPHFMRVRFEDGPLIGERRVIFPDRLDEAASAWLHSRFWELAEKGNIRVSESFSARFEENRVTVDGRVRVRCEIDLDRPQTDKETWREIHDALSVGRMPEIDPTPRRCDLRLTAGMLKHLSLPELFALNWRECLPELSPSDQALVDASKELDLDGIRKALAAGANPNCFDAKYRQTPLVLVVEGTASDNYDADLPETVKERREAVALEVIDLLIDAGAAVDLAGFNEDTPLATACLNSSARIITRLLQHGADPSIICYDDEYLGELSTAWEFADYRWNSHAGHDDMSAWDALTRFYPPPFEGVRLPETPETSDPLD